MADRAISIHVLATDTGLTVGCLGWSRSLKAIFVGLFSLDTVANIDSGPEGAQADGNRGKRRIDLQGLIEEWCSVTCVSGTAR